MLEGDRGEGWGCKGRRGEVWEGRDPGESLERTRGRGKSDVRSSSTPLHKDNTIMTSELSSFTQPDPPSPPHTHPKFDPKMPENHVYKKLQ